MTHATSTPAVSVFSFHSHEVRTVLINGEPWFVASDVCAALAYSNSSKAVADHLDDDERSTITNSESRNGGGKLTIINESGLYALVLRSRKPEARPFAKWVTGEVLPSIRKTGQYGQQAAPEPPMVDLLAQIKKSNTTPRIIFSPELQQAIDRNAWDLAHDAYGLLQEYLARRVAYHCQETIARKGDEKFAHTVIARTTLNMALAPFHHIEVEAILKFGHMAVDRAKMFMEAIQKDASAALPSRN